MNKDDGIYMPSSDHEREILKIEGIAYFRGYKRGIGESEEEIERLKKELEKCECYFWMQKDGR